MPRGVLVLASVIALPACFVALSSMTRTVEALRDPCMSWGASRNDSLTTERSGRLGGTLPGSPATSQDPHLNELGCSNRISGTSQTRKDALVQALTIPGGLLVASIIAIAGAAASLPALLLLGGFIFIAESFFISLAPFSAVAGALLILGARKVWEQRRIKGLKPAEQRGN